MTTTPDKRAALLAQLDQIMDDLARARDDAAITAQINAYAALQARFWTYSLGNMLLIAQQLGRRGKTPTRVAGFGTWIKMNRVPQRGTGLAILAPARYKEADPVTGEESWSVRGFRVVHVFDVSDTSVLPDRPDLYSAALPRWSTVDGDYTPLLRRLLDAARAQKIRVEIGCGQEDGVRGWSSGTGHIWLNSALSSGQMCGTLCHELAHELGHDLERRRAARQQAHGRARLELEAEAAAYALCTHFGVPRPDSALYVGLHGASSTQIRQSLESMRTIIATVMDAVREDEYAVAQEAEVGRTGSGAARAAAPAGGGA